MITIGGGAGGRDDESPGEELWGFLLDEIRGMDLPTFMAFGSAIERRTPWDGLGANLRSVLENMADGLLGESE